jgi:predicted house-cleaning noncanonical NTP pyrophosphatase (MazG superfamily)
MVIRGSEWSLLSAPQMVDYLLKLDPNLWVVRTDVASDIDVDKDLLPTSAPLASRDDLVTFMATTAEGFRRQGLDPDQWIFLPAPLLAARVSAMSFARPERSDVQVDALWGFPDGLMYLPHDSFLVAGEDKPQADVRFKPACYLFADGEWRTMSVGAPFDRGRTLSDDEVLLVASWTRTLANHLKVPVRLMSLLRIGGVSSSERCVPFYYTVGEVTRPGVETALLSRARNVVPIRSVDDVTDLSTYAGDLRGLSLLPNPDAVRDSELLRSVAELAVGRGVPIFFEGSLLAHAYHVLASTGATVVPVSPSRLAGTSISYNKLVRDLVPATIQEAGLLARVRPLEREEVLPLLRRKLVEEALEALAARDDELVGELADVVEVAGTLAKFVDGGAFAVERARQAKYAARGGFEGLVFLEATSAFPLDGLPPASKATKAAGDGGGKEIVCELTPDGGIAALFWRLSLIPQAGGQCHEVHLEKHQSVIVRLDYEVITGRLSLVTASAPDPRQLSILDLDAL